ncbi:MAG: hypothetical protein SOZ07_08345 [Prevotella sp.]|nr:hypothetical protein [Prevotella sp.]
MGAFGIYAIVVTFLFLVYYIVMISMDLFGKKGEKKNGVEVIHTSTPLNDVSQDIQPVVIGDVNEETHQSNDTEEATASYEQEVTPNESTESSLSAEDISEADEDVLAMQAKAKADSVKQSLEPITPSIQGAIYVEEVPEYYKPALENYKRAEEQAEQLSF